MKRPLIGSIKCETIPGIFLCSTAGKPTYICHLTKGAWRMALIEETYCPDIFVSGIGKIEKLGDVVRVSFYTERYNSTGQIEHVLALKVIRPLSTWAQSATMLAAALADATTTLLVLGETPDGLAH